MLNQMPITSVESYNMINKYLILMLAIFLVLPMLSATESLGTFKQNECINLIQTCSNCSYVNISSIINPQSTEVLGEVEMTKNGVMYNYTFCSTSQIGNYVVNGFGDLDGTITTWSYDFEVTPSGFTETLGFYILLVFLLGGVIVLGFSIKEGWLVVIGGMGLIILGVYSLNNGIAGFRDMFITWAISLFILGVGAYLSINSAIELIGDTQ